MDRSVGIRASAIPVWAYPLVWIALVVGVLALVAAEVAPIASWPALVFLAIAALLAEALSGQGAGSRTHQLALALVAAAILLVSPVGVVLVVLASRVPTFARSESPDARLATRADLGALSAWLIAALAAKAAFTLLGGQVANSLDAVTYSPVAVGAALLLLALLTRGLGLAIPGEVVRRSRREVAEMISERIGADVTLCCLGLITALLWQMAPGLALLVLFPLVLMRRALDAPDLERLSRTDPKTGLYNARHFGQVLQEESRRSARFGRPYTVIMTDLDLLRDVNNTFGHLAGDIALQTVANVIRESLREYDVAARFGGEEFVILLPECEVEKGELVAERLRESVEAARFAVPTSERPVGVTLSLGVASFPAHGSTPQAIVHQADLAVYRAKAAGRNRVRTAGGDRGASGTSGAGGAPPTWNAPVAAAGAATSNSEPTSEILAADLQNRARELALATAGSTNEGWSLGVTRGRIASVVAVGAILALGVLVLTSGTWMSGDYRVVGQALIAVLGFVAIAANGVSRQAIARTTAEAANLRHENRVLAQSLEETRAVARGLARQITALVEGRDSAGDADPHGESQHGEWLEVLTRAARRQRAGENSRKRPNQLAAEERRDRSTPPFPPTNHAS